MSHSRKDKVGGHCTREIEFKNTGIVIWTQGGRNFAKRFHSKQMRRHSRMSLRDLALMDYSDSWQILQDALEPEYHNFADSFFDEYRNDDLYVAPYEFENDDYSFDDIYYTYEESDSIYDVNDASIYCPHCGGHVS